VIRGEEHLPLNPSLAAAVGHGMTLRYVNRTRYRDRASASFLDELRSEYGDVYLLPEGGSNALAVRGCADIPAEIDIDFDVICCASGTGATLAGIATALPAGRRAIGFSVLKGDFLADEVRRLQHEYGRPTANWSIETGFHFGGYARRTADLDAFVTDFEARHGIALDRVYEAKMMYGIARQIDRGDVPPATTIVAVLA
jgi:1-aminocyclopropane-1-carboxylate deaminase